LLVLATLKGFPVLISKSIIEKKGGVRVGGFYWKDYSIYITPFTASITINHIPKALNNTARPMQLTTAHWKSSWKIRITNKLNRIKVVSSSELCDNYGSMMNASPKHRTVKQ